MEEVVDEWSIDNWSSNLDSWGSLDNCGSNSRSSNWGSSNLNWSRDLDSWGSVDKRSSNSWGSMNNWGGNSWGNGVNETIFIQILRESLKRQWNISSLCGDKVSNGSSQRSRHWSLVDIRSSSSSKENLGVSFSFSLVESVD